MAVNKPASSPPGLAESGRRLWAAVAKDYDLDIHEELLLREACRCVDRLDRLAVEAASAALTVQNVRGDQVCHPALVEARQQQLTFARLLASLRMPSGEQEGAARPQRRGAARGSYGVRSVS